jgi:hypothetical protein
MKHAWGQVRVLVNKKSKEKRILNGFRRSRMRKSVLD